MAGQQVSHTASGVRRTASGVTVEAEALRPDVVRVRMWRGGTAPEDSSWAVLPEARTARVPVTADGDGFRTTALAVHVGDDLRVSVTDLVGAVIARDAMPVSWTESGFRLTKEKAADEHFFGLGDKPGPLDRVGETFTMWNTDNFGWQELTDPIYKSIPFYIDYRAGRASGVLLDNTWRTTFDFGHERTDRTVMSAPGGPLTYYVMYGPEPKAVLGAYAWLTGPTPLPPLWSLGFQQSRYSYYPQAKVEEIAARLRADKIPTDVIWLDIDYQDRNRPFTVDKERFPDFKGLIGKLAAEEFRTIVITDLHIAHVAGEGYAPYESGKAGDHFVKLAGEDYVGPVWPGPSVFPEFTRAATRTWWGGLYREFMDDGIAGFWNDMNEPAVFRYPTKTFPDEVQHRIDEPAAEGFAKRTAAHPEIHNVFGMENSRGTFEGMLTLRPNLRPFVMTRASYAGGQRYSVTWTGDNTSTWNHLRMTTPQLENLGLSGFSMAGADVGGFAGSPPPDLLTKWLMLAAFQPIDRDHAAKGTRDHEPWVDGPEHEAIRRRFIEERYRLMPYLYTTAEKTSHDGVPMMRPLFVEFPQAAADGHPLDLEATQEFLLGPDVLVAASPSPEEVAPYEVRLPQGLWYDYWTGAKVERHQKYGVQDLEIRDAAMVDKPVMVTPKLDELPVYVRAGAIVPMAPLVQSTMEKPQGPLTLRVFPPAAGQACAGEVYADDGVSYDYRRGAFARVRATCSVGADGAVTVSVAAREGSFVPWWTEVRVEVVGLAAGSAQVNGAAAQVEKTPLGSALVLRALGRPATVVLR
ncbi:MAG: glycoside hydrolase family 31 protein [Acidobacteriaceae bacterium]